MESATTDTASIARVHAAVREQGEARRRLIEVLAEGLVAGVPQTELAKAVGVSRVTLWRWLTQGNTQEGAA